jgi:N-acetylmuramoyl-L-alanine amidase
VEGGFISSRAEGAQIANAAYRQKLAEAIGDGVIAYVTRVRSKQ